MLVRRLPLLILWLLPFTATASLLPSRDKIDSWLNTLGADGKFDPDKGLDWGIIPGPFYTPELGTGIGVALAGLYRPDRKDTLSQNSTLTISGYVSSTGAFGVGLDNHTFLSGDRWRLFATAYASNTPANYWGIGYNAGRNSHNIQHYTAHTFTLKPQIMYQWVPDVYIALNWSLLSFHASGIKTPDSTPTSGRLAGQRLRTTIFSSAPGISLSYDSRDSVSYPTRGTYAVLTYNGYARQTGSDNRFDDIRAHISLYHSFSPKRVLAWEANAHITEGDVPWNMLPSLGDSQHMRGYYQGRYRDHHLLSSQIELRQQLTWRHSLVAWLGMGTLSSHIRALGSDHWLPTTGIGYRFQIKPNINIRLDYGIGKGSSGFYFQLGEAF